jgi:glycopeptide antibiotics resistance protein
MIDNVRRMFMSMLKTSWTMVLISVVILMSIRITYLIKNKKKFVLYEEIFLLFFVMYILCLFQVVTFQDVSWSGSNFIPFREIMRYKVGTKLFFRNIFGNVLLFMPYGFFTGYYLKIRKPWISIILVMVASLSIEITQLIIGRVFDVDDIMLNLIGGILGFYVYHILDLIEDIMPKYLKKDWLISIIVIIFIVLIGVVIFV